MWWEDIPDWLSSLAALIAAVFAGLSWWSSRQSKSSENEAKKQANEATAAAEKAATAQQQTADEARRLADLAEGRATAAELKPWDLESARSGMATIYTLVNTTATPKYGVSVSGKSVPGTKLIGLVDGKGKARLKLFASGQIADPTITISWFQDEGQTGEPLTQRRQLT